MKKASIWRLFWCTPGRIRTPNLLVRSQTLYPVELRAHDYFDKSKKTAEKYLPNLELDTLEFLKNS